MRPYAYAQLIGKVKNATPGMVIALYGVMRLVFAAFNVSFGGVAGFVRPVIMPMAVGAIEASGHEPNDEYVEELKGMASGMENAAWFFGQVLFVGTADAPLVFLNDSERLLSAMGALCMLPMLLASLGAIFTAAGVGDVIATLVGGIIPKGNVTLGIIVFGVGRQARMCATASCITCCI